MRHLLVDVRHTFPAKKNLNPNGRIRVYKEDANSTNFPSYLCSTVETELKSFVINGQITGTHIFKHFEV